MHDVVSLATEAAEGGGDDAARTVAIVILLVALAAFAVAYWVVGPGRRRKGVRPDTDIPLAMRPYHSDEELETTGLERAMAWGVALTLFMAAFLPLYWLLEPTRIDEKVDEVYLESVASGRQIFADFCATCHGPNAEGGTAPNPYNPDAPWPAPRLSNIAARYADNDAVTDIEAFVTQTVRQGRPGTPMPAWSAAFNGSMNDEQIDDVVNYLMSIQQDEVAEAQAVTGRSGVSLFEEHCVRCHGPQGEGRVGPSLLEVFARYGADGSDAGMVAATDTVRQTILNGRIVPGYANMPSFRDVLSESALDRIVEYLVSIQEGAA